MNDLTFTHSRTGTSILSQWAGLDSGYGLALISISEQATLDTTDALE
jgi:hypothetical protein